MITTSTTDGTPCVFPLSRRGYFETNYLRYAHYAREAFAELEASVALVNSRWPVPLGQTARGSDVTPELSVLVRQRDRLSDSVKIFSAMAVEAFVNFYGVFRLGEAEFARRVDHLKLPKKLRLLLHVSDQIELAADDPLSSALISLVRHRNDLVHPKAKEHSAHVPAEDRDGDDIPGVAAECLQHLTMFFTVFGEHVPGAGHLLPDSSAAYVALQQTAEPEEYINR